MRGIALVPVPERASSNAKAMLDGTSGDFATILPCHSLATDASKGRLAIGMIDDPGTVRFIALPRPDYATEPPEGLTDVIFTGAKGVRAALEAVF